MLNFMILMEKLRILVDGKPYPGFIEFYDIFKKTYCQIKNEDSDIDYEDYDCDCDENYDSDDSNDGYFKTLSILLDSVSDF